jgi:hypothetical protein
MVLERSISFDDVAIRLRRTVGSHVRRSCGTSLGSSNNTTSPTRCALRIGRRARAGALGDLLGVPNGVPQLTRNAIIPFPILTGIRVSWRMVCPRQTLRTVAPHEAGEACFA